MHKNKIYKHTDTLVGFLWGWEEEEEEGVLLKRTHWKGRKRF